ncbi:BolA family protein [Silvanigrella aquatica]|uniref:BolA family transcriptional regulator n=1 Tax=Silvanigrella aquatica TaxID=1915309 RepID=A0A1L4D1E5_9BACT|nr:BolA/IbaG family iron-sulfur metabolism protein [Silvanigrella aquatica]APJ04029.1 hypothetical protein AXG55_08960 [Silvanigrella aquatica]
MLNHEVKQRIESGIQGAECLVSEFSGGNDHYSVVVIADAFDGQAALKRHRMIMELFQNEMNTGEVHALTIKTFTRQQWENEKQKMAAKPF